MISPTTSQTKTQWGFEPKLAVCPSCDWSYLIPTGLVVGRCPHCFRAKLDSLDEDPAVLGENLPYLLPPELLLEHTLTPEKISERIRSFASGIPFPPVDLIPQNLLQRLQRLFLPVWLVDAAVQAEWQMEAGFDYQVVSHQDRYSDGAGGWRSQEVKENRVRWEPRRGNLERTYQNIPVPALEDHASLRRALGEFDATTSIPYSPGLMEGVFFRLPDRSQQDAWPDAVPALQTAAARECQQAVEADHIRDFRWSPQFPNRNWTLMLVPVYTSYYTDDEGQPQTVIIHGQSGAASGARRASLKRAQRSAWIVLAVAAVLFVLSLFFGISGVLVPILLPVAAIGVVLAVLVALGALIPLYTVWSFNRQGEQRR
jgi:hypothetical protein